MEEKKVAKKKPLGKVRINTEQSRGTSKLLRLMIVQNPRQFVDVPFGDKGDVIWITHRNSEIDFDYIRNRLVNFLPGFEDVSEKKELSKHLAIMKDFFPEQYDFYPRTWILPEQFDEACAAMTNRRSVCYIIKPTSASQADGISIVKSASDLRLNRLVEVVVQEYIDPPLLLYK